MLEKCLGVCGMRCQRMRRRRLVNSLRAILVPMASPNPFEDPLRFEQRVPECAMVIFGATGDLNRRKLMPALYRMAYDRRLPAGFSVVGVSRSPLSDDEFRGRMCEAVKASSEDTEFNADVWQEFARGLFYVSGDVADPNLFQRMATKLAEIEQTRHTGGNVLFYLSVQPSHYAQGAAGIGAAGIAQ